MSERLRAWSLVALIIFLPLSAWLVSLTGQNWVGLGRDLLLAIFMLLSLANWRSLHRPAAATWLATAFVLLVLASYFYRQDSTEQWLRGVRYLIEPLLLFTTIQMFPISESRQILWRTLAAATCLVVIGAVIEFFAPQLLRATIDATGRGYLGQIHQAATLTRLQSTLAGPNALGLFMMVSLLLWPVWSKIIPRNLAIGSGVLGLLVILLTFSRSSYLGLFIGVLALLVAGRALLKGYTKPLAVGLLVTVVLIGGLYILQPQTLTRNNSNNVRIEQYQRLWNDKEQIGFWGRGAGAAGLVSVDRLDGGPNFYTENSYLDAYEAVGLLAALAYLGFWISLVWSLLRTRNTTSIAVGATVLGLAIAGIFINHYTGQAAIWLALLFAGLTVAEKPTPGQD